MSVALAEAAEAYPPAHLSATCLCACLCARPTTCMCHPPPPAAQPPTGRVLEAPPLLSTRPLAARACWSSCPPISHCLTGEAGEEQQGVWDAMASPGSARGLPWWGEGGFRRSGRPTCSSVMVSPTPSSSTTKASFSFRYSSCSRWACSSRAFLSSSSCGHRVGKSQVFGHRCSPHPCSGPCCPHRASVILLSPFLGTELLQDPDPFGPMLNRRQRPLLS